MTDKFDRLLRLADLANKARRKHQWHIHEVFIQEMEAIAYHRDWEGKQW